jgi:DNA polymerase-3 subunit epsilon
LDAQLRQIALRRELAATAADRALPAVSIRIDPSAWPAATLVSLADRQRSTDTLFGIYGSASKATNALRKLAATRDVCPHLLGLPANAAHGCGTCSAAGAAVGAACARDRTRHLLRLLTAIASLRLPSWPYPGPVAVREGRSVHVFDHWQYLGTVRTGVDLQGLLEARGKAFDIDVFRLLQSTLPRLRANAVRNVPASAANQRSEAGEEA